MVEILDMNLLNYANVVKKDLEIDIKDVPGAGAAGGLGFAMRAFFGAVLRPGIEIIAEAVHLRQRLECADLVITGEGQVDASSLHGKVPIIM
jgi:glycerate kinase